MIVHVVMFRPKPDLNADGRQRLADALTAAIRQIPSVRRSRVGQRVTHGRPYEQLMREDYTHIAILEFDDVAGLKAYLEHPVHEQLGAQFFESFEQALMYDYDVEEGEAGICKLVATD
jgi:hypothetical protein